MKKQEDEIFPLVDETGNIIGQATRKECHSNNNLLHPVVHVHIFNGNGEIYLQKRPHTKDIQPNKWDTAVGGHVDYGETIDQARTREILEETGLTDLQCTFITKYVWRSEVETELVHVFFAKYEYPITFRNEEIPDGKFWTINDITEAMNKDVFTPNFEQEFLRYVKKT